MGRVLVGLTQAATARAVHPGGEGEEREGGGGERGFSGARSGPAGVEQQHGGPWRSAPLHALSRHSHGALTPRYLRRRSEQHHRMPTRSWRWCGRFGGRTCLQTCAAMLLGFLGATAKTQSAAWRFSRQSGRTSRRRQGAMPVATRFEAARRGRRACTHMRRASMWRLGLRACLPHQRGARSRWRAPGALLSARLPDAALPSPSPDLRLIHDARRLCMRAGGVRSCASACVSERARDHKMA
jgi:hypothetical protein